MSVSAPSLRISPAQFKEAIEQLREFVAIPSVSHPNSPDYQMANLEKAAGFVSAKLEKLDFKVRSVRIDGSAPFVIAEKIVDPALRTIVLYGHYDVQPVEPKQWDTDPFVLTERDGRIYGRGSSDDKGGIIAILTALGAYQAAKMKLPVNVKVFFEGEEEYGSSHMGALLKKEAEALKGDALVVVDGLNRDAESGTLTSSTRGLANIHLRVKALDKPVHSGLGCLVPDPAQTLAGLIHSLRDPRAIPGFMDDCEPLNQKEKSILKQSSQSVESYAKENGLVEGAQLRGNPDISVYERIVEEPSISVINMNCGDPNGGNSIQDSAACNIGIRATPGQDPDRIAQIVMDHLRLQAVRYQLPIEIKQTKKGSWPWKANLSLPFSNLYLEALGENFKHVCAMPCGGALPLLREFQEHFPKMEMIVPGVEDPKTAAHSHNESQDIDLLKNQTNALISFLYKAGNIS